MSVKVGMKGQPPVVAVGVKKKPTYEELEAEVKRLREKLDITVRHNTTANKLAKDRGDQIKWLMEAKTKKD